MLSSSTLRRLDGCSGPEIPPAMLRADIFEGRVVGGLLSSSQSRLAGLRVGVASSPDSGPASDSTVQGVQVGVRWGWGRGPRARASAVCLPSGIGFSASNGGDQSSKHSEKLGTGNGSCGMNAVPLKSQQPIFMRPSSPDECNHHTLKPTTAFVLPQQRLVYFNLRYLSRP